MINYFEVAAAAARDAAEKVRAAKPTRSYYLAWRDDSGEEGYEEVYGTLAVQVERADACQRMREAEGWTTRQYEVREHMYGWVVYRASRKAVTHGGN